MKIGVVGIGRMGAVIAQRLLGFGHAVTVWNRTAEKTKAVAAAGARVAATPAALAAEVDLVLSILTDAAAIKMAYEGQDGLLSAKVAGKLFVEMSTVRPEVQVALAERVKAQGASLIDCPVGGSVGPAKEGKLFGFAGGAAEDVARARPVLDHLCRRVEHVGPVGAGESMKLAINLPLMVWYQALGEALSLCKPLGLEPARLMDIFADTSGGPNVLKSRGPMLAATLAGKDPGAVTFDIDSIRKDMRTMIAEARALGRALPVTERALDCYDEASREGLGGGDASLLPARWVRRGLQ
jgi:3-hydroxyisobutyrate dehydrogenase